MNSKERMTKLFDTFMDDKAGELVEDLLFLVYRTGYIAGFKDAGNDEIDEPEELDAVGEVEEQEDQLGR